MNATKIVEEVCFTMIKFESDSKTLFEAVVNKVEEVNWFGRVCIQIRRNLSWFRDVKCSFTKRANNVIAYYQPH